MSALASSRTTLYRLRHAIGLLAGAAVAWSPMGRGLAAYQLTDSGGCGFLCMYLVVAIYWWIVGAVGGLLTWAGLVLLLRQLRAKPAP